MNQPQTQESQPLTDAQKESIVKKALEEAGKEVNDSKDVEGKTDNAPSSQSSSTGDDVVKALNETLKRDFKSTEEALKMVQNLNNLVGDQEIAELRKKAKEAENFEAVIRTLAKNENLSYEAARERVLKEVDVKPSTEDRRAEVPQVSAEEFKALKLQVEERNLLDTVPASKHVMKQLKELSSIYEGKTLAEVYEISGLKVLAENAAEKEAKEKLPSSSVQSSSRQGYADSDVREVQGLINKVRETQSDVDKEKLVRKVLGLGK